MANPEVLLDRENRILRFAGEVNLENMNDIISYLEELNREEPRDDIDFYITSRGGLVDGLLPIYDIIKSLDCKVSTIGLGVCMSAGAVLLASGTGTRKAYPHTRIMLHHLSYFKSGDILDHKNLVDEHDRLNETLIEILAKESGQNEERVKEDLDRDFYLSAEEAKGYGLIDYVVQPKHTAKYGVKTE